MKRLLLTLLPLLFLPYCGKDNVLTSGTVVDKSYDDPDTFITYQCYSYRQDGGCSFSMPVEHTDAPHWRIKVEGPDPDDGDTIQEWHAVTESVYDSVNVGEEWTE